MKLQGIVASGVGQGAQFLALDWVRRELRDKIGLTPFPGTLNLRVAPDVRAALYAQREQFVRIVDLAAPDCPGYLAPVTLRANGRTCDRCWLVLPEKSVHTDVIEIISAQNLREELSLRDGDSVYAEVLAEARSLRNPN